MALNGDQTERYARHILLKEIGGQGQQKLLSARVLVVGAGGIGAPLIQYLVAAGIGTIGIVDDDVVALSNLQRQVLYKTADVGLPKVERAKAAAAELNPDITIIEHNERITADNAAQLIAGYDLVVEGIDNFAGRYVLNAACMRAQTPLISAAVGRLDGQLSVFKPFINPGILPCYRCLVPTEPPQEAQVNCAEEGVLGAVTGVMGTLAAMEVIKEILSLGRSLAGRLLIYEGLQGQSRTITLPADPNCIDCRQLTRIQSV